MKASRPRSDSGPDDASGSLSPWQSLRVVPRSYAAYTFALAAADLAYGLSRLALPWFLFSVTHSALILSLGAFAQMTSTWIGPFLGIITDRIDRRTALAVATLGRSLCWMAIGYLGLHPVWAVVGSRIGPLSWLAGILLLAFLEHGFGGLSMQASGVLRRILTPPRARMGISTLQFTAVNIAWYVSPALAGLVISRSGADVALWLTALSGVFLLGPVLALPRVPPAPPLPDGTVPSVVSDLREGARAFTREPLLVWLSGFGFFYNGVWAAVSAIAVALYRADLHMDATLVGLVSLLAGGVVTLVGALTPRMERRVSARALFMATLGVSGIGMLAMGVAGGWPEAAGGLTLLEVPATPWLVFTSLVAQARIPQAVYGRVNAIRTTISMGGMPLFSLFGGVLAQALGVRGGIVLWGAVTILSVVVLPHTPLARLGWPGETRREGHLPSVPAAPAEAGRSPPGPS